MDYLRTYPMEIREQDRAIEETQEPVVGTVGGHAAVFNVESNIGGWFREVIKPGAFKKTLREGDPVALWGHDHTKPLGRQSTGTLALVEDKVGLAVEINLPDTTYGNDAFMSIRRGDVLGMSFGFDVIKEAVTIPEDENELPLSEVLEVRLWEVSPVTFPQYEVTDIEARSVYEARIRLTNTTDPANVTHEPTGDGHSEADSERADAIRAHVARRQAARVRHIQIIQKWREVKN